MEAALLIGQFANSDSDCKVQIVQRGDVRPFVILLKCKDIQLKEMAAFALARLAQVRITSATVSFSSFTTNEGLVWNILKRVLSDWE